jgi:hypothetical protein
MKTFCTYGATATDVAAILAGATGNKIHKTRYAKTPVPAQNNNTSHKILTSIESKSKYSANPPQTPAIFLSVLDRINRLCKPTGAPTTGAPGTAETNLAPQL